MTMGLGESTKDDAESVFVATNCAARSHLIILAPVHVAAFDTCGALWRAVTKGAVTGRTGGESHGGFDFAPPILVAIGKDGCGELLL